MKKIFLFVGLFFFGCSNNIPDLTYYEPVGEKKDSMFWSPKKLGSIDDTIMVNNRLFVMADVYYGSYFEWMDLNGEIHYEMGFAKMGDTLWANNYKMDTQTVMGVVVNSYRK